MSMRLYTKDDWLIELSTKWKLTSTHEKTNTTQIWLTPNGKPISIPVLDDDDYYPDSLLNFVEDQLKALGEHPFQADATHGRVTAKRDG